MNAWNAAFWGGLAATSLVAGAWLAIRFRLSNFIIGAVMGFGGGALISSIAYELVPDSMIRGSGKLLAVAFILGALIFFGIDWAIDRKGGGNRKNITGQQEHGSGTAIFLGTLLDGIPESLILGMGLASGGVISFAFLMAVFVSNLPEGIAGTRSLLNVGRSKSHVLWMWTWLVIASAVASALGFAIVEWAPAADGRLARAFAAGAVLTMLSDVMMPEAFEHGGKIVGLLATIGFLTAAILSLVE
jgi:zinc transporter, ZIP family